ncbi:hypothetical protein APF67_00280 [Vibrio parahaemolyticus]|nr:hypothetical protein APF67_00280 [Vibrio parahaemolyticus]
MPLFACQLIYSFGICFASLFGILLLKVQRVSKVGFLSRFDVKVNKWQMTTSKLRLSSHIPMEYLGFRTRNTRIRQDKQNKAKCMFLLGFVVFGGHQQPKKT